MANENLQTALEQAGLTIEAFAEVIRVDPKSVQRWVTGNTVPYPRHRKAVARALALEERELWPGSTPAQEAADSVEGADGRSDVVGSWAHADDDTAPDPATFITDSNGPIDILDSASGIELTAKLTDRLAAQAAAGRPLRILTATPTEHLRALIGQPQAEVRLAELWGEFSFIRAGERVLFAINFQDDVTAFPPPLLELTGTITGGLFDRALGKFEELWQQACEDPQTLLTTHTQLDELLYRRKARRANTDDRQPGLQGHGGTAAVPSSPGQAQASAKPDQMTEPPTPRRRWPGRHD